MSLLQVLILGLLLLFNTAALLPAPSIVSMESVNMRHTLRWCPLQVSCNTSILYSVQFQGEFELTFLNGSWLEATECQLIPHTHCDMTFDLGSDSDYNLRVRGQCGLELSDWTALDPPFNRKHSMQMVPRMAVSVSGNTLHVAFDELPPAGDVKMMLWKAGDDLKAEVFSVSAKQSNLSFATLQEGAEYCVSARTLLVSQSSSTVPHCVTLPGAAPAVWLNPTVVIVSVLVSLGLLFAVFWVLLHCGPDLCQTCFQKEPLYQTLLVSLWEVRIPILNLNQEVWDCIDSVQRVQIKDLADKSRSIMDDDVNSEVFRFQHGFHHKLDVDFREQYDPQQVHPELLQTQFLVPQIAGPKKPVLAAL